MRERDDIRVQILNHISEHGIDVLTNKGCQVGEKIEDPTGILVRSMDLLKMKFNPSLLAIARAGAGFNNIPIQRCAEAGIVVFNAPGANAEAVKEMVLAELVMMSRDVLGSIEWVKSIADRGEEIPALVEKGKSAFAGPELQGKTIGVVGLGATGALVANACLDLGMQVYGYDPFMSVDAAWRLSRDVIHAEEISEIYKHCDYISINVPYNEHTHHMFDADAFAAMKDGVRISNESRAEVVDDDAILAAIHTGKVAKYITDFPNEKLIGKTNVICMPHIGACTPESEDKCAVLAARELYDYIVNGNIRNSVNLPTLEQDWSGETRLCIIHRNVPNMLASITAALSRENVNVENMTNKSKGNYAYTIVDVSARVGDAVADEIRAISGVLRVRVLRH